MVEPNCEDVDEDDDDEEDFDDDKAFDERGMI
jgi:hypothetical protein